MINLTYKNLLKQFENIDEGNVTDEILLILINQKCKVSQILFSLYSFSRAIAIIKA